MLGSSQIKPVTRRRLVGVTLLFGAILLTSAGVWAYAQERHDLPPFDHERAKQLSQEKRTEYERSLFNEIRDWNTGTPKYMGKDGTNRREADWLVMAQDGYELAYITLQILQPSTGIRYAVEKPLARLTKLADGGDAGAMCLYLDLIDRDPKGNQAKYIAPAYAYMQRGAELGHPGCLSTVGFFLMTGIRGFQKDMRKGFDASIRAAQLGYNGAGSVAVYLGRQEMKSAKDWTRYYCWQVQASQYSTYAKPTNVLWELRNQSKEPGSQALADRLETWRPTLDQCIALKLGDN